MLCAAFGAENHASITVLTNIFTAWIGYLRLHKSIYNFNICVVSNCTTKKLIAILILISFYFHFIYYFILFRFIFFIFLKACFKFVTVFIGKQLLIFVADGEM